MNRAWKLKSTEKFLKEADSADIVKVLLKNRKILKKEEIEEFFNPHLESFLDFKIADLEKGVKRILEALERREKVIVFADYDADGLCAGAILWETLYELKLNVLPYIPHRVKEGYGLNFEAIEKLAKEGTKLIITVDHGVTAIKEVKFAKKLGVDVVVCDHHEKPKILPECILIHTTRLCGAGVTLRFAYEIAKEFGFQDKIISEKLELCAIATIADLVPLKCQNRAIVKFGLESLNGTRRAGILALLSKTGLVLGKVSERDISHVLAPRLNAAGRLGDAILSLRLLCTKDPVQARNLAEELFETNFQRQEMLTRAILEAKGQFLDEGGIGFLTSENWHEGIIGLVASRMVEETGRPMVVISCGEKFSKGSARSVGNLNIVEVLQSFSDLLVDVGGHPAAAGFTIETEKIVKFQQKIRGVNLKDFEDKNFLEIDCQISLLNVNFPLWETILKFAPFGVGNLQPQFLTKNALVEDLKTVGQNLDHLKLIIEEKNAIAFGQAQKIDGLSPGKRIDLVYTVELNDFRNNKTLQLKVWDLAVSEDKK